MIYVMSDVHGYYENYLEFLNYVNFSDSDTLYILGDLIDRGSQGISVIKDVMRRKNVLTVRGNHEEMVLPALEDLCLARSDEDSQNIIYNSLAIGDFRQADTLNDFKNLKKSEQYDILNYIKSMPAYREITVNSQNYILVHGGLPEDYVDLEYCDETELLFGMHNYEYYGNNIVIVGHQPTCFISGAEPFKIYRYKNSINVDCGLDFGGQLGVLCLDTDEELYF